jgi:Zn-dependent protease with chaperone function
MRILQGDGGSGGGRASGGGGGDLSEGAGVGIAIVLVVAILLIAFLALAYLLDFLLTRTLSRYRELAADRRATVPTSHPEALAGALMKLKEALNGQSPADLRLVRGASALMICPATGWSLSALGNSPIACTSPAPAANELVRKYAHAPSPSTRQSSTPSDSRNCLGLIRLVMLPPGPI